MKNHSLLLLILVIFSNADILAQSIVIDSVVVKSCHYQPVDEPEYNATTIDSFSVDRSFVSSTQLDSLNSILSIDNYNYSPSGKMLLHTRQDFSPGVSVDSAIHSYVYNGNDSLLNYTLMMYNNSVLIGSSRIICQYDSINHTKLETREASNSSGVWVPLSQILYSFDPANKLIRQENSNAVGGILTLSNSKWFEYLPNDSLDLYYFRNYSNLPQNDSVMYDYSYDTMGYLISIEKFIWDSANATFGIPLEHWIIYYDSTHTLIGNSSAWYLGIPGALWERIDSTYYEYDSQNRLIYEQEGIMPHGGHWTEYIYYPGTNDIDSINYCRWATQSGNCLFCKYEYHSLILDIRNYQKEQFAIFPNPANNEFVISLPEDLSENVRIVITDPQSKIVFQKAYPHKSNSVSIRDLDLRSEIYFITVAGNHFNRTQKLLVVK